MSNRPLVSVLMTAYNREIFIPLAIESVLRSTYDNWELVIVDDCSTDNTTTIAKSYAKKDPRVRVYVNEKNLGDYPNRNKAISYAQGEYILFCDSDDELLPESIFKALKGIETTKNFNFALCWAYCKEIKTMTSVEAIKEHFFGTQFLYIGPGGTFMRRSFVNSIGGYPEKYGPANDMYFNLKVVCHTSISLFPFDLIFYREHDGQELNNKYSYLYNNFLYLNEALSQLALPLSDNQISRLKTKNYRRFIINSLRYYGETHDLKRTIKAWQLAKFNYKYLLKGIFQ